MIKHRHGGNVRTRLHPMESTRPALCCSPMFRIFLFLLGLIATIPHAHAGGASMRALAVEDAPITAAMPPVPDDWTVVPSPFADVHSTNGDKPTALRLSRHIAATLPGLARELDLAIGNRIHVVVAPTQAAFHDLQPGRAPDWADGPAWPKHGWIFLRAPRLRGQTTETLEMVLEHELVHILLGRAFGSRTVPRWLQEGLAQLMAGEYTAETTKTLAQGTLGDNLISLQELSRGFPKNPLRAHLAYAQSADLVAFIRNEYGPTALKKVIHGLAAGENFAPTIRRATGDLVEEVDHKWRSRLKASPFQLSPLMDEGVWWGLGAFLVPLAWFAARRRNRKKLDRWKREEILEDALYRTIERVFNDPDDEEDPPDGQDDIGPPIWPTH